MSSLPVPLQLSALAMVAGTSLRLMYLLCPNFPFLHFCLVILQLSNFAADCVPGRGTTSGVETADACYAVPHSVNGRSTATHAATSCRAPRQQQQIRWLNFATSTNVTWRPSVAISRPQSMHKRYTTVQTETRYSTVQTETRSKHHTPAIRYRKLCENRQYVYRFVFDSSPGYLRG